MSLHPHVIAPVPAETARVARAAFPKGHPYLTFRDGIGTVFQDEDFAAIFSMNGQPGLPPWLLSWWATLPLTNALTAEVYGLKHLGTLRDLTGSYDLPFAIAGLLLCGASLLSFAIREQRYSTRYQTAAGTTGD